MDGESKVDAAMTFSRGNDRRGVFDARALMAAQRSQNEAKLDTSEEKQSPGRGGAEKRSTAPSDRMPPAGKRYRQN